MNKCALCDKPILTEIEYADGNHRFCCYVHLKAFKRINTKKFFVRSMKPDVIPKKMGIGWINMAVIAEKRRDKEMIENARHIPKEKQRGKTSQD